MIEIKDVRKSFNGQEVLKGVTTSFDPGKTSLVLGASGSGKTVLIKCMVGLLNPTSGHVYYNGQDFMEMGKNGRKAIRQEIGMLFQGSALFDSMTVEENVILPLNMFTNWTQAKKRERVNFCLDRVNLVGANDKFPSEISGGMAKRVGIARAIVLNPKYLFCDEPNSGLDPKTAGVIDELIQEITHENNITTIINTHDMNSVMEIGEKVVFLHKGEKHWEGTAKEILTSTDQILNDFIFASEFLRDAKKAMLEKEGKSAG